MIYWNMVLGISRDWSFWDWVRVQARSAGRLVARAEVTSKPLWWVQQATIHPSLLVHRWGWSWLLIIESHHCAKHNERKKRSGTGQNILLTHSIGLSALYLRQGVQCAGTLAMTQPQAWTRTCQDTMALTLSASSKTRRAKTGTSKQS